jgi:ABC-type phosphate transport system substrate-binding protein
MHLQRLCVLTAVMMLGSSAALAAEVAVIVNKNNANAVDKTLLVEIYTGRTKLWKSGDAITSYDLAEDSPVRASFCQNLLGKSVGNMKAVAAQNLFSGKAVPPKQVASDEDVKKAVSASKSAIGYIKASSADDSVRVILVY